MSIPEDVSDENPLNRIRFIGYFPKLQVLKFTSDDDDKIIITKSGYTLSRMAHFSDDELDAMLEYGRVLLHKNE